MLDFRSARGRLWRLLGRAYRSPRGLHQPGFRRRGFRFDHDVLPRNNGPRFLMRCALLLRPCSRVQRRLPTQCWRRVARCAPRISVRTSRRLASTRQPAQFRGRSPTSRATCVVGIARNNPVCEPVSFAGHSVPVSVARRGPRLNPMPPRGRGAVSANTVRWLCQPG
jgi:hypothetical protein